MCARVIHGQFLRFEPIGHDVCGDRHTNRIARRSGSPISGQDHVDKRNGSPSRLHRGMLHGRMQGKLSNGGGASPAAHEIRFISNQNKIAAAGIAVEAARATLTRDVYLTSVQNERS